MASVVDVGALWQTIWTAALAGVLVTICCSVAVLGAARAHEHRTAGSAAVTSAPWVLVAVLGSLAMVAVIVYGLVLVVD